MNSSCSSFHTIHEKGKMAHEHLQKRHIGLHKNGTWVFAKKTYKIKQKWHVSACKKDIWDYTKLAHERLWKRHMGLHKIGRWMLVKNTYGTTQNWQMNACEKHIWDYTKLADECLWKTHMGLHKYDTWVLVKKAYGDALPSPGVNPLEGSPKCNYRKRNSEGAPSFQL